MAERLPVSFETRLSDRKVWKARYLAPFFQKYRERLDFSEVSERRRVAYREGVVTDDRKLFYVKNPKAGCTTIAHILFHYSKGRPCTDRVHNKNNGLIQYQHNWREFEAALNGDAVSFTFVRHPEKRIVSAFRNFFVDKRNRTHGKHLQALESRGFSDDNSMSRNFGIFLDYVEESFATDLLYTNRHWRPQHINVALGDIRYDVIGKLESLDQDLEKVFALIGEVEALKKARTDEKHNASTGASYTPNAEERARVERLYEKDYEAFGY